MHCALETMPGFHFIQSCCGGDQVSHTSDGCDDDVCGEIESGLYKIDETTPEAPLPALTLAFVLAEWLALPPVDAREKVIALSHSPPELPNGWQFSYRAASLPRAPSLPV